MTSNVLTPTNIWKDFYIDFIPSTDIIEESEKDGVILTRFYLQGRKTPAGQVKIYAVSARLAEGKQFPAVCVFPDFDEGIDDDLLIALSREGYYAVAVDLAGDMGKGGRFTVYPEYLSYANYLQAKDNLFSVPDDVRGTCYYEWDCVGKYLIEYLKNCDFVGKIGGIGIGEASTVLWHLSINDTLFSSAVILFNSGWQIYSGSRKFGSESASDFSDEELKYLAGIEPSAYAPYVNCPVYLVSPTNSRKYDCDRAIDTVSRVKNGIYFGLDYSVNYSEFIEKDEFTSVLYFLEKGLKNVKDTFLPPVPEIDAVCSGKNITVNVKAFTEKIKKLSVYVAENTENPVYRTWIKIGEEKSEEEKVSFSYVPYFGTTEVFFFARAEYEKGYSVSSGIASVKLDEKEINTCHKSNIIFSGREKFSESAFCGLYSENTKSVDVFGKTFAGLKKGPMDIVGIYGDTGVMTLKVSAEKFKPSDDAVLIFDVYIKESACLTVSFFTEENGKRTEYSYKIDISGGEVWYNERIESIKFKTEQNMPLKSYANVKAITFKADKECLINNVLLV